MTVTVRFTAHLEAIVTVHRSLLQRLLGRDRPDPRFVVGDRFGWYWMATGHVITDRRICRALDQGWERWLAERELESVRAAKRFYDAELPGASRR